MFALQSAAVWPAEARAVGWLLVRYRSLEDDARLKITLQKQRRPQQQHHQPSSSGMPALYQVYVRTTDHHHHLRLSMAMVDSESEFDRAEVFNNKARERGEKLEICQPVPLPQSSSCALFTPTIANL